MNELPVWVGGKEKIVGGLNRHTRCEDVIAILLQDRYKLSKCELSPANLECYALFEKWRGCERQLSPRTRMYKLWKAWGAERDNVKFTLRKSVAISKRRNSLDSEVDGESGGIKLREKTKQMKSQGQYNLKEGIVAFDLKKKTSSGEGRVNRESKKKEKRRRSWADESDVGFSDVRILCPPPLDCDSSASTSSSSGKVTAEGPTTLAEEVEGKAKLLLNEQDSEALIQRILKQSHQLHNLLETISSVDTDIDMYETRLHNFRMHADGRNYVQEAYLSGSGNDGEAAEGNSAGHFAKSFGHLSLGDQSPDPNTRVPSAPHEVAIRDLEEYTALCDRLFHADEQLRQTQDVVSDLAQEIFQETSEQQADPTDMSEIKPSTRPRRYEKKRGACSTKLTQNRAAKDIGVARTQLERSAQASVAKCSEIDTLQGELHETEKVYNDKCDRLNKLTNELAQLEKDVHERSTEDDEIRVCVEQNHSSPVNMRSKNSSMESSLDQGIDHDFSPIDMTNRKSPSRSCDTDSSSDTGLSSLHSQDDSEQMVYNIAETLV
ncbi:ras association domain-containing protein 10-like [Lytechinus pictus]|uniref:ras association domain-containing protein 10-like n=1 Tax=Lytechinus pictus TaxID=7653 RepID=UPI0030B9FDAF